MNIDPTILRNLIQRIVDTATVEKIILFGSAASGTMTRDSDIDLLVLEANPSNTREESIRIRRSLRGIGFPIDVLVMSSERFEETKSVIGSIAYPANMNGKVIYEAA